MSLSPLLMACASDEIYTAPSSVYDHYWEIGGVVLGHKVVDNTDLLVLRGSATAEDWVRDATAIPKWHPQLGFCHAGFLEGMDEVYAAVRQMVTKRLAISGHSLGGSRARILAALFAAYGFPCAGGSLQLCTFGAPKAGFINHARVIQKSGMEHASYRNRNDIVPILPFLIPLWEHSEPWIHVDAAPADDDFEPLRDHSSALYVQALTPIIK